MYQLNLIKEDTMSDPTNVFGTNNEEQKPQETPEQVNPQSNDVFSDQLKGIKAEELTHSQSLIPTLQSQVTALELDKTNLREELAKNKGAQELVDSLTNHQQESQQGNPSETQFGEADVARMLEATLDKREKAQVQTTNADKVQNTLVTTFGAKAQEVVQAKAKELNMTPEALGALAATSPDMVLALFNSKSTSPSVTNSSFNLHAQQQETTPLGRPEASLLSGATSAEQREFMAKVKAEVYAKHGITE